MRIIKKSFLINLTVCLLLVTAISRFRISASNQTPVAEWDISATQNDNVSALLFEDAESTDKYTLLITGIGDMISYAAPTDVPWFQYSLSIIRADIDYGVSKLSGYALSECMFLEEVTIRNPSIILPANSAEISFMTKIYAHRISTAKAFVTAYYPERLFYICDFKDGVCTACGYTCTQHTGGLASCTELAKCEICSEEYGNFNPHNYSELIPDTQQTCSTDGIAAHYLCLDCNGIFDRDKNAIDKSQLITPAAHLFGEFFPQKSATCTEPGIIPHYHCSRCDGNFDKNGATLPNIFIPATEHVGGTATCTEKAICEVCKSEYGKINPDNHVYKDLKSYDTERHWNECACGLKKDAEAHVYTTKTVIKEPTETETGLEELFCLCGYSYQKTIPKLPQSPPPISPSDSSPIGVILAITLPVGAVLVGLSVFLIIRFKKGKHNV